MNVVPGTRFGHWVIVQITGRAALVQCRCGSVRRVALDALTSGTSVSCGCFGASRAVRKEAEARQRQRDQRNWRGPKQ